MKNEFRDELDGRSSSGTFSSILLDTGPPPMPHMTPMHTRPRISIHTASGSMNANTSMDASITTQETMAKGRLPYLSASLPIHTQKARVDTAGISRYDPLAMLPMPISICR